MSTATHVLDRNSDSRKILWAVLASILIHLLVAFSLATFGNRLTSSSAEVEDRPPELTIVNVAPPPSPAKANPEFLETDASKKSAEAPKEKTFESNENSIAASQQPATGESNLPSQAGKDRSFPSLETHDSSIGLEPKPPQPIPAPSSPPMPQATQAPLTTPTPAAIPTPSPDQLAMLTATPPPAMQTPDEIETSTPAAMPTPAERAPEQPESSYRAFKEQTHIQGRISNRGPSAVNAVGTPLGRYQKTIIDSIGSRWLFYTKKQADLVAIGTAHVTFWIDRDGHVQNLKMTANSSNEAFANVCLQSIEEVHAPPIPAEVSDVLPPEGLNIDVSFTMFSN
jgi:outer membrane biosynthesis protein TonB